MQTLGTKVDNSLAERFKELCNQEGCSVSEAIRVMIQQYCNEVEEAIEIDNKNPKKPQTTIPEFEVNQGKLYDKDGNIFGAIPPYNIEFGKIYDQNNILVGKVKGFEPKPIVTIRD